MKVLSLLEESYNAKRKLVSIMECRSNRTIVMLADDLNESLNWFRDYPKDKDNCFKLQNLLKRVKRYKI